MANCVMWPTDRLSRSLAGRRSHKVAAHLITRPTSAKSQNCRVPHRVHLRDRRLCWSCGGRRCGSNGDGQGRVIDGRRSQVVV